MQRVWPGPTGMYVIVVGGRGVVVAQQEKNEEDESEVLEESPYGFWQKHND